MTVDARQFRMSLARKLSLLTGAVIAACLLVVLVFAYEVLTHSTLSAAAEGIARATRQLASVAEMGIRQSRPRYLAAAHDPAVHRAIAAADGRGSGLSPGQPARSDTTAAAANQVLARLAVPADSELPIELWSASGRLVAHVGANEPVVPESATDARTLGPPHLPRLGIDDVIALDSLQFGRLYASGDRVYFWLVQPVTEGGRVTGYIAQQRRISAPGGDRSVRALAGEGVSTYYHNIDGGSWSTLEGKPVSAPRVLPNDPRRAMRGRDEVLIAEAPINGSSFVVTMESRVRDVLAAPRRTVQLLTFVGIALLLAGMGAALLIGRGIARPIAAIADGAEAIARGQYDTRVSPSGEVEVARLADSFNHMANEVAVAQRALEHKTADAQAASRAKSDFLATVSHELRTPLNAIAGYTELLEMGLRGPLTDAQRRDLARIRASGQHLLGLISGVLDLSRIERGQVTYSLGAVSTEPFLADLDGLVSPQAAAKSLTLEYLPSHEPLTVIADREKLRQIMLNLLSNAIRFTPAGGRITLSSTAIGDSRVEIRVEDTGPGIPENRRAQVFEPFVQLDRSLTQPQEGLGLGLAISRDLARGMHGDLTLGGGPNVGARFMLTLPRSPVDEVANLATSGETPAYGSA